ncbi:MAG: ATP-binding protein [Acidobacteriota bacterium]|nr:ATP-binding protein [Acidobacteriota bacterium]
MSDLNREKILARGAAKDFVGRTSESDALLRHAKNESAAARGLILLSAPILGASELLRQTYDRLFADQQNETIPFYFALRRQDKTARRAALHFLQTFLQQTVAFRRRDAKILDSSPDIFELAELSLPPDGHWIDRLVATCQTESKLTDERFFFRTCLSAPLRAAAEGANVFVMIDNLHEAESFSGDTDFVEELKEIYSRSNVAFVFSGHRRFLFGATLAGVARLENTETLELKPLNFADAGALVENLAENFALKISEQTRDLIAVQAAGNPAFIRNLFQAASEKQKDLDSFQNVEQIYADEIFGGASSKYYDAVFEEIVPNVETQKQILRLLYDALAVENQKMPIESWQARTGLNDADFRSVMRLLKNAEIIRLTSNLVAAMTENGVLSDYIKGRFRLEVAGDSRALVVGESLSDFLKRAPLLMARFYQRSSALGLREILSIFNCQEIPVGLLDYSVFSSEIKGATESEIVEYFSKETEKIILPQIIYTAHAAAFYPPLSQVAEPEQTAIGSGFERKNYTDAEEIVWIAAEVESKLEASKDVTEFWCDRLEMVALMCNFRRYKIWLVAPQGFSTEAVEVLKQRNAFFSSRRQFDLLVKFLKAETGGGEKLKTNEYEMVVPMGDDTELIAAHAIEEIARRYSFAPKAINQIKTALVEACINATEHSHSPDQKIYQKFSVEDDKIVITISNRGLRLADKKAVEIAPDEGRRGWGLKLMKTLMDEVKFEQVDDGTRISMVKYMTK